MNSSGPRSIVRATDHMPSESQDKVQKDEPPALPPFDLPFLEESSASFFSLNFMYQTISLWKAFGDVNVHAFSGKSSATSFTSSPRSVKSPMASASLIFNPFPGAHGGSTSSAIILPQSTLLNHLCFITSSAPSLP